MTKNETSEDRKVLLQIQNSQKPYELIYLVWDRGNNVFQTEGLKNLFGVKEIRVESRGLLGSLERYGHVLSFLLETMSAAKDYHLPYAYQSEFEFGNEKYSLHEEGDYRVLKQLGGENRKSMPLRL
jgi:hypothetical protein